MAELSTHTTIVSLQKRLEAVRGNTVSCAGESGYFVKLDALDSIEDDIESLMENKIVSPNALMSLRDQVVESRNAATLAESALKSAMKEVADLRKEMETAERDHRARKLELDTRTNDLKISQEKYKNLVKDSEESLGKLKLQAAMVKRSSDVEEGEAIAATMSQLKEQLANDKAELKSVNSQIKEANLLMDKQNKLKASISQALTEASASLSQLKAEKASVLAEVLNAPVTVAINPSWVSSAIGSKGLEWIKKAAEVKEAEIRERAYNLLMAAKSGKRNPTISPIVALLEFAFDWIKKATMSMRLALKDWLNELQRDFSSGNLKRVKYYREALEKVVGKIEKAAKATAKAVAETTQEHLPKLNWMENVIVEWKTWTGRAKRYVTSKVVRYRKAVKAVFSRVKDLVFGKPKGFDPVSDEKVLFDAGSEESSNEESEVDEVPISPLKPLPPAPELSPTSSSVGTVAYIGPTKERRLSSASIPGFMRVKGRGGKGK